MDNITNLLFYDFLYYKICPKIPKVWTNNGGFNDISDCGYYDGKKYWILVVGCGGLAVGLLRYFSGYPDILPGLFEEIQTFHVEPKWQAKIIYFKNK